MSAEEDIILAIEDPVKINNTSLKEIEKLIEQYPFCQSLHALLSKKAALEDLNSSKQLIQKASAYSVDRKTLHWLHHNKEWSKPQQPQSESTLKDKVSDKPKTEQKVIPIKPEIPIPDLSSNVYEASFEKLKSELIEKEDKVIDAEQTIEPKEIIESKEAEEKVKPDPIEHKDKSLSMTEWLNLFEGKTTDPVEVEKKPEVNQEPLFKLPQQEEVLKAIESINKPKINVTANEPMNFGIVTETLAKILIKQGQLDKAIQVYKDLSLQNPEKSAYFDAQIKNLKDQL